MRRKGGSLAAPLCLQPLRLSCTHMVLKVKVSHQADEADVAGFHHVSNLLCHYRQSFSCFLIRLFVCFLMCLKSTSWWIPSLHPHASLHTLLPPSKPDIKHALLNFMKKKHPLSVPDGDEKQELWNWAFLCCFLKMVEATDLGKH